MTTRTKIILLVNILIILSGIFYVIGNAQIPYPSSDPKCGTEWRLVFYFISEKYCGGGEYYLFACQIEPYKHNTIYKPVCISSISEVKNLYFLPNILR